MIEIILAIILVVVLIVSYIISVQRRLVRLDEMRQNALSQIGVQQNSRWDALVLLIEMTKEYSKHEYQSLKDIISERKPIDGLSLAADIVGQEKTLDRLFGRLMAVAEQYPNLKAQELYAEAMSDVNSYEQNVRLSRMVYNDSITKINRAIRQFPESIIAKHLGFTIFEYIEEPKGKTEMPTFNQNQSAS